MPVYDAPDRTDPSGTSADSSGRMVRHPRPIRMHLAGLWQETNSFSPFHSQLGDFERGYLLERQGVLDRLRGTATEIGGFLDFLEQEPGVCLCPGIAGWAAPGGPLEEATFETLSQRLLGCLAEDLPVDGVLLSLHGALVSERSMDCEGALLERIRRLVGEAIPVVCSLDFHAVVTERMVSAADVLTGYRTYPHIDHAETGGRAARALCSILSGGGILTTVFGTLPLVLPVENTETESGPLTRVIECLRELDSDAKVLSASFFTPHPWLDVEEMGVTMVVHVKGDSPAEHSRAVRETLSEVWSDRQEFFLDFQDINGFLQGVGSYTRPILAVDLGDITSAGGRGDSTVILRALLNHPRPPSTAIPLVDPQTVSRAFEMGEGYLGEFEPGGSWEEGYNQRVPLRARVVRISEEPLLIKGPVFSGMSVELGRRALLESDRNLFLIASEYGSLMHDPEILRSMGLEPENLEVIIQKSHKLFRPAYHGLAGSVVQIDTPGFTDRNIRRLPYQRIRRPIYPLDELPVSEATPRIQVFRRARA